MPRVSYQCVCVCVFVICYTDRQAGKKKKKITNHRDKGKKCLEKQGAMVLTTKTQGEMGDKNDKSVYNGRVYDVLREKWQAFLLVEVFNAK